MDSEGLAIYLYCAGNKAQICTTCSRLSFTLCGLNMHEHKNVLHLRESTILNSEII